MSSLTFGHLLVVIWVNKSLPNALREDMETSIIILNISLNSQNNFSRLVCFGVGFNIFVYLAVNLGMVTGLIPVVGVPLPIISYGGTAMLTTMFALGLVMSAKIHKDHNL